MEYNKNRFQKTNDKKILHKVKKQWVVLSVALLAALGGGATVATTHASANADGANGQNNDQETTVKNRINQNLKLAQNQSANNNASQGQTKQVNVNSLSSDQITKQANMLHNQMLLGAAQGTNTKTANGRQAARQNAETNRINANTSAVASAANQQPAANANHSRMFGAAAPSANFGSMRLGGNNGQQGALGHRIQLNLESMSEDAKHVDNYFPDAKKAFVKYIRETSGTVTEANAKAAYRDLTSLASESNVSNAASNGMVVGSDTPANSGDNWIGQLNRTKKDLDTINKNGNNPKVTSLDAKVDSLANRLYNSSINSNVSVSSTVSADQIQSLANSAAKTSAVSLAKSAVKSKIATLPSSKTVNNPLTGSQQAIDPQSLAQQAMDGYDYNSHVHVTVTLPTNVSVRGIAHVNDSISNIINNGFNTRIDATATIPDVSASVKVSDLPNPSKSNPLGKKTSTLTLNHITNKTVNKTIPYHIAPLANDAFNAYDIATMLDGHKENDKNPDLDDLASKVITTKATTQKRKDALTRAAKAIRQGAKAISEPEVASEYQNMLNDAYKMPDDNAQNEESHLSDIASNDDAIVNSLKANNDDSSVTSALSAGGSYAKSWANSISTASSSINSASSFAKSASSQASVDANSAYVKADSANISGSMNSAINQLSNDYTIIKADSASYSSNADISYKSNVAAGSGSSAPLASDAAPNASYYAKDASAEMSTINSMVSDANKNKKAVYQSAPVHIVYEDNDGNIQKTYDEYNNTFVNKSDSYTVQLVGDRNSNVTISNGTHLYDASDTYTRTLGSDTNYSLAAISDNGSNVAGSSMTAHIQSDGNWNWGTSNANNQSTPTFYYKAVAGKGADIDVQYINQNGYKVPVYPTSLASNGMSGVDYKANSISTGIHSEDVQYSGSNDYGDTINILNGLQSSGRNPVTSASGSNTSGYYTYGFNNSDTNPSFSDYTFNNSEQTATLPIHGNEIPASYKNLVINVAVRNHKGSFVNSDTKSTAYTMSQLASMAGSNGPVHYGDLIKVDPQEFAPAGTDVTSSDYNVDKFANASDNSNQNVPFIYVSQDGPKWINTENREDAVPSDMPTNTDLQKTINVTTATASGEDKIIKDVKTPADHPNEPTFNDPNSTKYPQDVNHLTFNYLNGAHKGTVSPIHVTYKDQNNNVVSQGTIYPKDVHYGDQINIPGGTDVTNPSDDNAISAVTVPSGYSFDYDKNGSQADHYQINSDYNSNGYINYTNVGMPNQSSNSVGFSSASDTRTNNININKKNSTPDWQGQDITLYVDGNYTTSTNKLNATIEHTDKNGKTTVLGTIPITINGFNGDTRKVAPSDYLGQAMTHFDGTSDNGNNDTKQVNGHTVSILDGDTITSSDGPYNVKFLANNGLSVVDHNGNIVQPSDTGVQAGSIQNGTLGNQGNGIVFDYRDPSNESNTHTVHIRYFYSDASDIPNGQTPTSIQYNGKPIIQLNKTDIVTHTMGKDLDLTPYVANPPKGYQFVRVMSDSDSKNAFTGNTQSDFDNYSNIVNHSDGHIPLTSDANDKTVDIKVIPTAGSITFHYYNQNGKAVKPDSDDQITGEKSGQDFTNSGINYNDVSDSSLFNTHTEFGNTPTQYKNTGNKYYSRYGTYFNVSDIPVPTGYHISHDFAQGQNRYYRFDRTHQDVDVMVTGNPDDVAHDPSNPSNPTTSPGDKGNPVNSEGQPTNSTQHQNADTIWVTIHEMDPANNQIRQYDIPEYISGNTGDTANIYAADYTPEAQKNQQGKVEYYFTPYSNNTVSDKDNDADNKVNNNYTQANVTINSDGTTTADYDNNVHNVINRNYNGGTNNHFDFYYYVKQSNNNMQPINVTYMDGSKAVGFKQITPTMSDNYFGQDIKNTITYNNGDTHGDTPNNNMDIPSGYQLVNKGDTYPTTIDDNHPQNIVIPVMENKTRNLSDTYTVINNFYSGADHDMSHFVGTSSVSTHLSSVYSGELEPVSPSASAAYNGVNYSGGSENSSVDVDILGGNSATPNVIVYNYYSSASVKPSQAGPQGSKVANTAQPIYVQYYAGSNSSIVNSGNIPSSDYIIGNDTRLNGKSGFTYKDVTKVTPVPAGYYLDPSNQTVSHTISDQPYQMDLHVSRINTSDGNVSFPVTVILKDQHGKDLTHYTTSMQINNNTSDAITASDYNPNSTEFTYDTNDDRNDPNPNGDSNGLLRIKNTNGRLNAPSATYVYNLDTNTPSDIAPIHVTYIDKDTGAKVNASNVPNTANGINTINGNYMNQNFSDITKEDGTGTSTVPSNYKLVPHQNLDDHISGNPQNVDVLVENKNNNPKHYLKVNVVEENKDNGTAKYVSDVYYAPITSDTSVDPHNFIPTSDAQASDYNGNISDATLGVKPGNQDAPYYTANAKSHDYYMDPVDHIQTAVTGQDKTVTFIYDKGHQHNYSGSIILKYFNQNGQQVGYTDVIHGQNKPSDNNPKDKFNRNGQQINVTKTNNGGDVNNYSTGEPVPNGYHLVPSDQPTNYTFHNDDQYVDLYVNGQPQTATVNIYIHKETPSDPSGDAPGDISKTSTTVTTPVGGKDTFYPDNYTPTNYHVDPNHANTESVTVASDGSLIGPNGSKVTSDMNSNINFYYNQNSMVYANPYIIRYVNQNGQQVGYTDVVNNPKVINSSDVNLTRLSDGGENIPQGYLLDTSHKANDGGNEPMSSNSSDITNQPYSDQSIEHYKFGNNHDITLKVIGKQVTVPLVVHLDELNNNGIPTNLSDAYSYEDWIRDKKVGDTFYLNADQYLDKDNATNNSFDGHYLPNNSDGSNYQVAPNRTDFSRGIDIDNNIKKVTIEEDKNGNAYAAIDEVSKGATGQTSDTTPVEDNQLIFYYEPSKNEQPAPVNVFFIDKATGRLIKKGFIPVNGGEVAGQGINHTIPDVVGANSDTTTPSDYQLDPNPDSTDESKLYPATVMHNEQNVYVPVSPQPASSLSITVHANIKNAVGSTISTASSNVDMSNPSVAASYGIGGSASFSPYSYAYLASNYSVYPTNSDHDQSISDIQGNHHYDVYFNYQQAANQSNFNLGTINVHYVTRGTNDGENIQIGQSGYYQVDQESDHGMNGQTFDLTDYLNDIPSYQNNYYYLVSKSSDAMNIKNNQGIIGYYDIYNSPVDSSKKLPTDSLPLPTSLTDFHYHTDPRNDVHTIFGDPTFATRASNTSTDPGYNEAKDTKDIYILVSPDSIDDHGYIPDTNSDSTGNGNATNKTGNNATNNPSLINGNRSFSGNGYIPDNQGNNAGGDENHTFTR